MTRMVCAPLVAACLVLVLAAPAAAKSDRTAPPLPPPTGPVVHVSTEPQLRSAVQSLASNTTIVIAPGTYRLTGTLNVRNVQNVTLRGATDNRNDVVLVGPGMSNTNYGSARFAIWAGNVRGLRIANLTIRDFYSHLVILNAGVETPHFYNLRLVDGGTQLIKSNPDGAGGGVDNGLVEYTAFEYTTQARSYYTSGVDVHTGANWVIRHNLFRNIRAPQGQVADPAILIWNGSSGTIVEGNTFVNCQRGIALGLQQRTPNDHSGGVIRNNFIYRAPTVPGYTLISVNDSPNTDVLHNTVLTSGQSSAIEYRFAHTTGVVVANNLTDARIWVRDGATGTQHTNDTTASPPMFVDAPGGNLHLRADASAAIDRGVYMTDAPLDWDGEQRPAGAAPDIGADELGAGSPPPVDPSPTPLPAPWETRDIGSVAAAGSADYQNGTFTLAGSGVDIWGSADEFRFVYRALAGDGEVSARVTRIDETDPWAKAGVMIRETLTAGSRNAMMHVSAVNGAWFQWRGTTGGTSQSTAGASVRAPYWIRVSRQGTTIRGYQSADGVAWTLVGSTTLNLPGTVYIGLAVTSHRDGTRTTGTFADVK